MWGCSELWVTEAVVFEETVRCASSSLMGLCRVIMLVSKWRLQKKLSLCDSNYPVLELFICTGYILYYDLILVPVYSVHCNRSYLSYSRVNPVILSSKPKTISLKCQWLCIVLHVPEAHHEFTSGENMSCSSAGLDIKTGVLYILRYIIGHSENTQIILFFNNCGNWYSNTGNLHIVLDYYSGKETNY